MKKLPTDRFEADLPIVRLYESDLQDILRILERPNVAITFRQKDAEYDSIDDLREHLGDSLRQLEIRASLRERDQYGSLRVDFRDDRGVWLRADAAFELEFARIEKLLKEHARRRVPTGLGTASFAVVSFFWYAIGRDAFHLSIAEASLGLLWVLLTTSFFVGRVKVFRNLVVLKKQHEHETFFQRHREHIWRGVFAIVALILGALLNQYFQKPK